MGRYRRFSLKTLVIAMTVLTVWIGLKANRANRQRRAVERIEGHGGQFYYDYQVIPASRGATIGLSSYDRDRPLPGPDWLRHALSEHYFITPIELRFHAFGDVSTIPDGDLALLSDLPDLQRLSLWGEKLSDADAAQIPELRKLRHFHIEPTIYPGDNSIEDYSFLRGFPRLVDLSVAFGLFSDDDAEYLSTGIRRLNLDYTQIGDEGLRHLQKLTKLERLDLAGTKVTDTGLSRLTSFPNLQILNLNETSITDDGLVQLRSLTTLQYLRLINTPITNTGLQHLKSLAGLKHVEIIGTRISDEGAAELHDALPNCRIQVDWGRSIPP